MKLQPAVDLWSTRVVDMTDEEKYARVTWEYLVLDEPNRVALQEQLAKSAHEGWEAIALACSGDVRFAALMRRRV
jgi:hypothetical protein